MKLRALSFAVLALYSLLAASCNFDDYASRFSSQSVAITVDGQTQRVGIGTTVVFRDPHTAEKTVVSVDPVPSPTPSVSP